MTLQGTIWLQSFLDDPVYGHFKLKRLKGSLSAFYEPRLNVVPAVELEDFRVIDADYLPLLVGSQFGTFPQPEVVFKDGKDRTVVILGFSMLSGVMSGLSVYKFKGPKAISKIHSIEFPHHLLRLDNE